VPSPETGDLRIEDVWFSYPGAQSPALAGISLTLRSAEIVALVGANGAGKTTLVKLIARLYDPDQGRILLAGTDLRTWPLDALRRCIAIVSQEALRFEATVADNVAYGDWPRAAGDESRVRAAAAAAGAAGMGDRLPRGYDTVLGEAFGEHDFSNGQWQRIALARAFVRDCPILLLDEPTAQLDGAAIEGFKRRLSDLARGRTTLLISHRLETLLLADRILLIERGRITRSVTRAELLAHADSGPPLFTDES
jgi:ATP-binding cassette subfamily B protein